MRERRKLYKTPEKQDELAAKRRARQGNSKAKARKRTESSDSAATVGDMEQAVISECAEIPEAKPTQVVAAKNLARLIDRLVNEAAGASVLNSTTKQLMQVMGQIRGDTEKGKATGRRKSGGRLATVGALTKVKRAQ